MSESSQVAGIHRENHPTPTPEQLQEAWARFVQEKNNSRRDTVLKSATWLKPIIPIIISALLSAVMTGIVTVNSISRELAVEHASVSIVLADYDRRISGLEKVIVPRSEQDTTNKSIQDALRGVQDQMKTTNSNVDEIRRILYERFSPYKR